MQFVCWNCEVESNVVCVVGRELHSGKCRAKQYMWNIVRN